MQPYYYNIDNTCVTDEVVLRVTDIELRCLALSLDIEFSAWSALSSDSSKSCWTLRYFAKFMAATSSCKKMEG